MTIKKPLHDRVLVRPTASEETTKGGIIIPDSAKEKPVTGEVVAAGPGGRNQYGNLIPTIVAIGDKVLYGKYNGVEVEVSGEKLIIMREAEILAIVE